VNTKPIYRLESSDRIAEVRRLRGKPVEVVVNRLRAKHGEERHFGVLVAVGSAMVGSSGDFLALRDGTGYDRAWSLATVVSVEELPI
jgi:hypothetical protein